MNPHKKIKPNTEDENTNLDTNNINRYDFQRNGEVRENIHTDESKEDNMDTDESKENNELSEKIINLPANWESIKNKKRVA